MPDHTSTPPPRSVFQFRLRTLLGVTLMLALLLGTLRWLGVPAGVTAAVLGVLLLGFLAAAGLVIAIARTSPEDDENAGK